MGVDLKLLPAYEEELGSWSMASAMLNFELRPGIYRALQRMPKNPVAPTEFRCHLATRPDGEPEYGPLLADAYGEPIRWAGAGDLARVIAGEPSFSFVEDPPTLAALRYLEALPAGWPVVLYWS